MIKIIILFFALLLTKNSLAGNFNFSGVVETQAGAGSTGGARMNAWINSGYKKDDLLLKMNLWIGNAANESMGSMFVLDDFSLKYKYKYKPISIKLGIMHGVSEEFRIDSSTISSGSGGINGDYFRYFKYNLDSTNMILSPQMPISGGFATSNYISINNNIGTLQNYFNGARSVKLSVITDDYYGFKFGMSFIPSVYDGYVSLENGQNLIEYASSVPGNNYNIKNAIVSAVNYSNNFISLSLAHEYGEAEKLNNNKNWLARKNLNSISLGGKVKYNNFQIAGSFIDYGKSLFYSQDGTSSTMKINNNGSLSSFSRSYLYNLGIGYKKDNWSTSISYLQGNYMNNKSKIINFGIDRKIKINNNINLLQYFEISHAAVRYPNYYDNNSILIVDNTKQSLIMFAGLKFQFN